MGSRAKTHWENWTLDRLRVLARKKYQIDPRGLKKKDLIHEMRVKDQDDE